LATELVLLLAYTREHIDRATWVAKITRRTAMYLYNVTNLHFDAFWHIKNYRRFLFVWSTTAFDSPPSDTSIINISLTDARSVKRTHHELR